jgi:hypothetical protein
MVDLGHGRGWLNPEPAASIARIDAQIGHPQQITEAGRTYAQQLAHWNTYQRNGHPIALHPDTPSVHQKGAAIDTDERHVTILNDHGWYQTVYRNGKLVEPWHFEYFPKRDNHYGEEAMSAAAEKQIKELYEAYRAGKAGSHSDSEGWRRLKAIEAQTTANEAAIRALAKANGADGDAILKAVREEVREALTGATITL